MNPLGKSLIEFYGEDTDQIVEDLPVDRKYKFKSGVNIMFGCNNFCSYCMVTGRMGNNLLVHFPGDAYMIGTFKQIHLDVCKGFYYMGTPAE